MCCFSPVSAPIGFFARMFGRAAAPVHVSDTAIFARMVGESIQALVYSMELSVDGDVAMILPVPVTQGGHEDALEFVNLEKAPRFFEDLRGLFVVPMPASMPRGGLQFAPQSLPKLKVHAVGSFEASYVPTIKDFSRLDERFRLPDAVWSELGEYKDWGFAVFRLAPSKTAHIHPMAFKFRTRDPGRLFFPTVHVHDGKVHESAHFDHELYYQPRTDDGGAPSDESSDERSMLKNGRDVEGLLVQNAHVYRRKLHGALPNRDTWIL